IASPLPSRRKSSRSSSLIPRRTPSPAFRQDVRSRRMARVDTASAHASDLIPFVPRLTLEWLRDHPEQLWLERDATVAFVDISGFTAMSEKLSKLGKAGAEEVTDVMNATF